MNSKRIQKFAAVLVAVLLMIYIGYQIYLAGHKGIVTELAMYGSVSDTVQVQGFVVRKEQVVNVNYSGVLSYRIEDGERVAQGGVIAEVYSDESDASASSRIEQLNREIRVLEELSRPTDIFSVTPDMVSTQIYLTVNDLLTESRGGNFNRMASLKEDLLLQLNRKQLIVGQESTDEYAQRIAELIRDRDDLAAASKAAVNHITADASGYFISSTDGLEDAFEFESVTDITPEQVKDLLEKESREGPALGKICSDFNWYMVCVIPEKDLWRFEEAESVELNIPLTGAKSIPAQIVSQNRDPETGDTAMVFQCSYMDAGIAQVRSAEIEVCVRTYSGVLVRESALRFCDVPYTERDENGNEVEKIAHNVKGVYVANGPQLWFVQVFSERSVNGYAICKTVLSKEESALLVTDNTIRLYDNVVVEGTNLYDGKPT